jgi:hypothetical protein
MTACTCCPRATPPLLPVTDAAIRAELTSGALGADRLHRQQLADGLGALNTLWPQRRRTYTGICGTTFSAASTMAVAAGRSASTSLGLMAPSEAI